METINQNVGSGRDERRPFRQQLDHKILHVPNQVIYGMVRNSESNHGGRQQTGHVRRKCNMEKAKVASNASYDFYFLHSRLCEITFDIQIGFNPKKHEQG